MAWHHIIIAVEGQPSAFTAQVVRDVQETATRMGRQVIIQAQDADGGLTLHMTRGEHPDLMLHTQHKI